METKKTIIKRKYPAFDIDIRFQSRRDDISIGMLIIKIDRPIIETYILDITQEEAKEMINILNRLLEEKKK
jgi:hypothetical protein